MKQQCYSLFVFLIQLCLSRSMNTLPNITIQHVCEHDILFLKCSKPNETIQIIRSMYGRTSQRICNDDLTNKIFYKTCANIEQSKIETKLRCQGKSTCQILIDNSIYTDPCGSTIPKHFEIHYRCFDLNQFCLNLFQNCSQTKDLQCIKNVQIDYSCLCPSSICEYNLENELIDFKQMTCAEESFQSIHWPKTLVNKGQQMSCPYPCTGQIFRFCQENHQWSSPNYTDCQCPLIEKRSSNRKHFLANSFVFQCQFWLINRLLPKENNVCIFETTDDQSSTCLRSAFENLSNQFCQSFRIDFQNLHWEIFIPKFNEKIIHLSINNITLIKDAVALPLLAIQDQNSVILIEQSQNASLSRQSANLTVAFNHQSSEVRYQCRAYRSINDSSDMFFVCKILCSNTTHTICQCPFYHSAMRYVLHLDTSISNDEFELSLIETNLQGQCSSLNKLDYYLKKFTEFTRKTTVVESQKKYFLEKLISFIDTTLVDQRNLSNMIHQIEYLNLKFLDNFNSLHIIGKHIEFFIQSNHLQSTDQSIRIELPSKRNASFFILSNITQSNQLNSHILDFHSNENFQIIFRHLIRLNQSNQISICVHLKNQQWLTDQCTLVNFNATHTICSCKQVSIMAVLITYHNRLELISNIICIISIICLIFILISLILRRQFSIDDDLILVRNFLHINLFISLLVAQILFLSMKFRFIIGIISIFLPYFLLSSFSWMFVDSIELILALKNLFKIDRIRLIAYAFYAYGFPFLIVLLAILLANHGHFSNQFSRSLAFDNPFIWTFGIPFVLLILMNIGFLIFSFKSNCSSLRKTSILSILFGLMNLIYLYQQQTLFNSCQGLILCLFYYLFNQDMQYFHPMNKSSSHYNTSSSGYSSAQSSEAAKFDHQQLPIGSTEHNEELLRKYQLDDHPYYEIG